MFSVILVYYKKRKMKVNMYSSSHQTIKLTLTRKKEGFYLICCTKESRQILITYLIRFRLRFNFNMGYA